MALRKKGKWRDLGMVYKPSCKCFKNDKIIFIQVILKLECLFYQNIYVWLNLGIWTILEFEQSWNFFHQLYNYSKKILYETQQNIYILNQLDEIYKMTRSIKCRDLRNFLEFIKNRSYKIFFFIFKNFFAYLKIWLRFLHHFVDLVELILNIYILLGLIKYFFTIIL